MNKMEHYEMIIKITLDIDGNEYPFSCSILNATPALKESAALLLVRGLGDLLSVQLLGEEADPNNGWPKYGSRLTSQIVPEEIHQKRVALLKAAK